MVERVSAGSVDFDLVEDGELHAELAPRELPLLLRRARRLPSELVAGESDRHEAVLAVAVVKDPELRVIHALQRSFRRHCDGNRRMEVACEPRAPASCEPRAVAHR